MVASTMVTHHTASLTTASACGTSIARAPASRCAALAIALTDQLSAVPAACWLPAFSLFQARRQRAEQNLSCSRRGSNAAPHCSQLRAPVITPWYGVLSTVTD